MFRYSLLLLAGCDLVFPLDPLATPDAGIGIDGMLIGDGAMPPDDSIPPGVFPHLPPSVMVGSADLTFSAVTRIDTSLGTIEPPSNAEVVVVTQPDGPALFVVGGRDITLGGTILVSGTRGLVIVGRTISVTGKIDASANDEVAGPGAQALGGTGDGKVGIAMGSEVIGGGGGSFGPGARAGGAIASGGCTLFGGDPGAQVTDTTLAVLQGGANGGGGAQCSTPGGLGGGALQLSAQTTITVSGTITVNGGGGPGGRACGGNLADGGSGGGSGGAIYLDAPAVHVLANGVLVANGGGGGGGGCDGPQPTNGFAGSGGLVAASEAPGGPSVQNGCGTVGGWGAYSTFPGGMGGLQDCDGQTGGGGGGVGHIVMRADTVDAPGLVSPPAQTVAR